MARKSSTELHVVDSGVAPRTATAAKKATQSNNLRLRIDDLKTFEPLTNNQRLFLKHIRDKIIS